MEYPGKHEPLVSEQLFEQVQRALTGRRVANERTSKHEHYLAGSLFCARCGARLLFGYQRGKSGTQYPYFFCSGRHSGRTECKLPWLPLAQVERAVTQHWRTQGVSQEILEQVRQHVSAELEHFQAERQAERDRLQQRLESLKRERYKWADLAMKGTVPDDSARAKQRELQGQLAGIQAALAEVAGSDLQQQVILDQALQLLQHADAAYARAADLERREYNQAFYAGWDLDSGEDGPRLDGARLTPLLAALHDQARQSQPDQRKAASPPPLTEPSSNSNTRSRLLALQTVRCVNFDRLVELWGLEPQTS